ncbi:beta-carotene 15,15'-monooxygenase [Chryseobacterium sp. JJR-5R]|uniref:beta-carotene 15,15'-monooxygenase n=1 Tax=Chryseobacterium sp. JJR-5R TaxID=3093923 RepID=UPI002A749FCE|nr:beta-carotene 15,15'-monooxygenase [Chryseobacterium sp. JJR-5R]WPO82852.1 beta-carotene 15,15'-monooxygenase [Chryseobacterium sp. JJR-5R]
MDTTSIKNLFKLKSSPAEPVQEELPETEINPDEESSEESRKRTYHESGYRDSSRTSGNHSTLSICLDAVYSRFQNEEKEMVEKQQKLKESYVNEQKNRETEIKAFTVSVETKEEQVKNKNKEIEIHQQDAEALKAEILDLPRNPEKYNVKATRGASAKFWIGAIILTFITLYLLTFYISTSYSAFFKVFDSKITLIQNVLDAKAWEKAWDDGLIEGAFVTLIPFVFLGLGYLIHMFWENKTRINYIKIGVLLAITFVFDIILAYQIEFRLYNFEKVFDSPPFDLKIAFSHVQFWAIIFAGFIVYIIWGLVFDFVMKEHREKDRIKNEQEIRQKKVEFLTEKANALKKEIEDINANIGSIKESVIKTRGRIEELQNIIDGVIIPTKDYKMYASEYVQGWITFIGERIAVSRTEKQIMIDSCIDTYNTNLDTVGANDNNQNLVYLSSL